MSDPTPVIAAAFAASFRDHRDRVHRLAEGVTDAQFWVRPYPYGNSMGHLVLHLTGNLNYFIGRQMAGTGYVRDREREFHDPNPPSKSRRAAAAGRSRRAGDRDDRGADRGRLDRGL